MSVKVASFLTGLGAAILMFTVAMMVIELAFTDLPLPVKLALGVATSVALGVVASLVHWRVKREGSDSRR